MESSEFASKYVNVKDKNQKFLKVPTDSRPRISWVNFYKKYPDVYYRMRSMMISIGAHDGDYFCLDLRPYGIVKLRGMNLDNEIEGLPKSIGVSPRIKELKLTKERITHG